MHEVQSSTSQRDCWAQRLKNRPGNFAFVEFLWVPSDRGLMKWQDSYGGCAYGLRLRGSSATRLSK